MLCALIQDNKVVAIKELQEEEIQLLGSQYEIIIDVSGMSPTPQIGDVFNGQTIVNTNPSMNITKLAMRQRMTFPELIALTRAATFGDPLYNAAVAALKDNLAVATFIDLARPDTIAAVNLLVGLGLLTSQRADIILNTIPAPLEKYTG